MAQITSREELEDWLRDKPNDWAQVIAARAALRILPSAFGNETSHNWVDEFALVVIRATTISWAARNSPASKMLTAADFACFGCNSASKAAASASSAFFTARASYAAALAAASVASAGGPAIFESEGDPVAPYIYAAITANSAYATADSAAVWANINYDCEWLAALGDFPAATLRLTGERLWRAMQPEGWFVAWSFAATRLLTLDPTYQVWIDWYNRRIEGHDAAFDIPGDTDRTHDKAILARLADATNKDFWGKGATHVNTTLQSWIDEAREQAAIDYVASGAPLNIGSEAELAARPELLARFAEVEAELAKLKDQRASLADSGHGQIGHNLPKGAGSLRDEEIALLNQRVAELEAIVPAIGAVLAKLETVVPAAATVPTLAVEAVAELVVRVPELNLWQRAIQPLEDRTSPEVRKGFESAVGASLLSIPYIAYVTLPEAIRAFLHYFYTVWFPILPG